MLATMTNTRTCNLRLGNHQQNSGHQAPPQRGSQVTPRLGLACWAPGQPHPLPRLLMVLLRPRACLPGRAAPGQAPSSEPVRPRSGEEEPCLWPPSVPSVLGGQCHRQASPGELSEGEGSFPSTPSPSLSMLGGPFTTPAVALPGPGGGPAPPLLQGLGCV